MALLNPNQIHRVLGEAGLTAKPEASLKELLESNGLGANEVLQELSFVMKGSENPSARMTAIKTAAQLNGLLANEDGVNIPIVNIIINDPEFVNVNPILLPR